MSDIVPYERLRFPRGDVRRWLLESGARSADEIAGWLRLSQREFEAEAVEAELEGHPALFIRQLDGRWRGRPEEATVVVIPTYVRTRPRPKPRTRKAKRTEATGSAREPRWRDPFHTEDGAVRSVIFRRDVEAEGETYESGGRLVVPMPQEVEATDAVRRALLKACEESEEIEVFEQAGSSYVFRGTRRLLRAEAAPGGTRVELMFDRADDDKGRYRALALSAPQLSAGASSTMALALPAPALAAALGLPEPLQRAALAPSPTGLVTRPDVFARADELLRAVEAAPSKWPAFQEWLVGQKRSIDSEAVERILAMAVARDHCPTMKVIELARLLVGDEPTTAHFAEAFVMAAAELRDVAALTWAAGFLGLAVSEDGSDAYLLRDAGRVASGGGDGDDACRLFGRALQADPDCLDASHFEDYLLAAGDSKERDVRGAAIASLDSAFERLSDDGSRFAFVEGLKLALQMEQIDSPHKAVERQQTVVQLQLRWAPGQAVKEVALACSDQNIGVGAKLDLLSLLEVSDAAVVGDYLIGALPAVVEEAFQVPGQRAAWDAVEQLRFVETLLELGHDESDRQLLRVEQRAAATQRSKRGATEPAPPLDPVLGKRFAVGNGHPNTRSRIVMRLLEAGASEVREVPSSEEANINKAQVRAHVTAADVVVNLIDYGSHQFTHALDGLREDDPGIVVVRASGGPSRVLRTVREYLLAGH